MKNILKILASLLLLFNGIGAIYGGWHLTTHPDGSSLAIPMHFLRHTPFDDFFVPGIILFVANGLFSLFGFAALFFNFKNYPLLVIAQGVILSGWIIIQCIMLRAVGSLHIIYGLIGLLLIACGWSLTKMKSSEVEKQKAIL